MYLSLCAYFLAFSVNALAGMLVLAFCGWGSLYAWVYSLTSLPIFAAIAWITWASLGSREHRLRAVATSFILSVTIGHLVFVEIARPTAYDWITLIEGVLLVWAGTLLGFAASYSERKDIALCLSITWLVQSLFSFGFALHWGWPEWLEMNFYVPQLISAIGFSLIGWRLRAGVRSRQLATRLQRIGT
jgi:hypothetical protein